MQLFDREKASWLMKQQGIDLLLASSKHGVGYLSDYWHPVSDDYYVLWAVEATHKTFVGLPGDLQSDAFLVAGASEQTTVSIMDPWIQDRRFWGPGYYIQTWDDPLNAETPPGDPMEVVAEAIESRGLESATVAIEKRFLGVKYVEALRSLLPRIQLVDAESLLWQLRMVKSDEEQQRLRESCRLTSAAWLATVRDATTGMTQPELQRVFVKHCMDNGLEYERAYVIFGPSGLNLINGSPASGDVRLEEGMFIRIDAQAKYRSYVCNLSRVVAHGPVNDAMAEAHELERRLIVDLIPELKPGVAVADIRRKELAMYEQIGQPPLVPYTGHGVGRVVHEPPYLATNDPTILEPGMSVTLEPHIMYSGDGDIFVGMEDHFLITENDAEWLTETAPMGLYM